jgi:hypothetical protein
MAKIPDFMLRALYMKGSLKNNEEGFEFQIKNDFGPVRIIGAGPLLVDRKPVPLESCGFVHEGSEARFSDVSAEQSVLMRKGEAISVHVSGITLKRGRRSLGINVTVKDLGQIRFSVTDLVAI